MNNLTLISCSYNTPLVTENMLKSFLNIHPDTKILISENSTNTETKDILEKGNVPFFLNSGGLHGSSVDLLLEKVDTDYALLVDTDVVFFRSCSELFESFKSNDLSLMGEIVGDRGGKRLHKRVHPWFCFINVKNIKSKGIKFYDEERLRSRGEIRYDVGSSFFEDIKKSGLRIGEVKAEPYYFKHYEGMSWRVNRFGDADGDIDNDVSGTHNNKALYNYGLQVLENYKKETNCLNSLVLYYGKS
jgi:hypothetical protein